MIQLSFVNTLVTPSIFAILRMWHIPLELCVCVCGCYFAVSCCSNSLDYWLSIHLYRDDWHSFEYSIFYFLSPCKLFVSRLLSWLSSHLCRDYWHSFEYAIFYFLSPCRLFVARLWSWLNSHLYRDDWHSFEYPIFYFLLPSRLSFITKCTFLYKNKRYKNR